MKEEEQSFTIIPNLLKKLFIMIEYFCDEIRFPFFWDTLYSVFKLFIIFIHGKKRTKEYRTPNTPHISEILF